MIVAWRQKVIRRWYKVIRRQNTAKYQKCKYVYRKDDSVWRTRLQNKIFPPQFRHISLLKKKVMLFFIWFSCSKKLTIPLLRYQCETKSLLTTNWLISNRCHMIPPPKKTKQKKKHNRFNAWTSFSIANIYLFFIFAYLFLCYLFCA